MQNKKIYMNIGAFSPALEASANKADASKASGGRQEETDEIEFSGSNTQPKKKGDYNGFSIDHLREEEQGSDHYAQHASAQLAHHRHDEGDQRSPGGH
jgi:hypothetical protein